MQTTHTIRMFKTDTATIQLFMAKCKFHHKTNKLSKDVPLHTDFEQKTLSTVTARCYNELSAIAPNLKACDKCERASERARVREREREREGGGGSSRLTPADLPDLLEEEALEALLGRCLPPEP